MNSPILVTIKEAAQMLGVTPLTLRNWDARGKLKALRHPLNNYRVYNKSEIENLLKNMQNGAAPIYKPRRKKYRKLDIKHMRE